MPGTSNRSCASRGDVLCWRSLQPISHKKTGSIPQQVSATHVARLFSFDPDVSLHQSQPLRHTDTRAFRSVGFLFQIPVRQQTFRCPLVHEIRQGVRQHVMKSNFCLAEIAGGPTSSKCDLTLMTDVLPLRPAINGKRIDHRFPFGRFSSSHLCVTPFVTYFASIGSRMLVFSSTRLSA